MNRYDFVFLLNEEAELKNLKELVKSAAGKVVEEKSLGKKNLAYPIKKNTSADFYDWSLELDEGGVTQLKKKLNFNEKLIRYILLKQD